MSIAVYPGTFDPFTNGHLDITKRALKLFDKVIIAVSDHGRKNTMFSIEERCKSIEEATANLGNIEVMPFEGLLTTFTENVGGNVIIRGLRVNSDFEYEFTMAKFIDELNHGKNIEVIYLMADCKTLHISSTAIKEMARLDADISKYVPSNIAKLMENKND